MEENLKQHFRREDIQMNKNTITMEMQIKTTEISQNTPNKMIK